MFPPLDTLAPPTLSPIDADVGVLALPKRLAYASIVTKPEADVVPLFSIVSAPAPAIPADEHTMHAPMPSHVIVPCPVAIFHWAHASWLSNVSLKTDVAPGGGPASSSVPLEPDDEVEEVDEVELEVPLAPLDPLAPLFPLDEDEDDALDAEVPLPPSVRPAPELPLDDDALSSRSSAAPVSVLQATNAMHTSETVSERSSTVSR